MDQTAKKYVKVPNQKGIWKNTVTKKYLATKKIKGKQFTQTFESVRHALHWKHTFNGEKISELYRDLAMFQFYVAGRISEAAGVQISNIYMDQEFLVIKDV